MTTASKIHANRANARASTGPKTADGRARSARNALRHALSLPVYSNPALSEEVETLAREIAGPDANAETKELARRVAEAQIDLRRVRYARHKLLSDALADPHYDSWRGTAREDGGTPKSPAEERAGPAGGKRGGISELDAARAAQVRNNPLTRG